MFQAEQIRQIYELGMVTAESVRVFRFSFMRSKVEVEPTVGDERTPSGVWGMCRRGLFCVPSGQRTA